MWFLFISRNVKLLFFATLFLLYGLSAKAQQDIDTTRLPAVSFSGDTATLKIEIEDLSSFQLSDEELRIFIMRTLRHGSPEASMLNDPLFAPTEKFYGLFNAQRPSWATGELELKKQISENLQREFDNNKKAATAGTIYWILQWLLIFL